MANKPLFMALGFLGLFGVEEVSELPKDIRKWTLEMHQEQIKLLKIDWGQPGFCTEWDRDYDPTTRSCGRRGKLIRRKYLK